MKLSLMVAISIISAMGVASPTFAQTKVSINSEMTRKVLTITPYDLVTASYQGRFVGQGIPSAGRFTSAVRSNRIKAEDLVKVAISQRRLSIETLEDRGYLYNVQSILDNLDRN
ncbi:MAG: hypothetical protein ACFCAD_02765 [Pleurocapsa sp.]